MLNVVLFALVGAAIAAPAVFTMTLSGAYERRYLRSLARKAIADFPS